MSTRIQDLPEDDRPRERLIEQGPEALSDAELLAIFINTGLKGENAIEVARRILRETPSLRALSRRTPKELLKTHRGLGPAKAAHIAAAFELGRRAAQEEVIAQPMNEPELVWRYLGNNMALLGHETLRILLLNTRMCLIHDEVIFTGTVNESVAHPREIIRSAVVHHAYGFVLAHNHPSGDPSPSQADISFTRRIREAAELMKLVFADHVIIGAPRPGAQPWFSFRAAGML
jgi:DNA repair protein RadC